MKAQPIPFPDLEAIQHALRQGKTTCRALVEHYLHNIEVCRDLNAYVEVFADEALNRADAMDQGGTQAMGKLRERLSVSRMSYHLQAMSSLPEVRF